jgi:hypothetical protein
MVKGFTLNTKQVCAFQIVAEHSLLTRPKPLYMFIGGAGGIGKSYVTNFLKELFHSYNQCRQFHLILYIGVVAENILEMTLHLIPSIGQYTHYSVGTKTN